MNDIGLYLQLYARGLMCYLRYLCLCVHSDVQHILCCVFALFVFGLCTSMLPVSVDCPFSVGPAIFSTVYDKSLNA